MNMKQVRSFFSVFTLAFAVSCAAAEKPFYMNILTGSVGNEEKFAEDAKEYVRRTGNPIVLCSLSFHPEGYPAKVKSDVLVESYRKVNRLLKGSDVKLGVLIQSVMGHWARVDEKNEPWHRTVTIKGDVKRFCPWDPGFKAYIRNFCRELAAEKPSIVLGDDDIHMNDECFCDLHRAEFNRRTGRNFNAKEFRDAVAASKPGDPVHSAFFAIQRETVTGVCKLIRESLDEVDPTIPAGMCMSWVEYPFIGDLAKAIAAKGQKPLLRIANCGGYHEFDRDTLAYLALHTAEYAAVYAKDFTIVDESDVFPHALWSKSASNLRAKHAFSFMTGVDGGLLWLTCGRKYGYKMPDNYARAIESSKFKHEAIKAFADESEAIGFTIPVQTNFPSWHFNGTGRDMFVCNDNWATRAAALFGIPFRASTSLDDGGVYAIGGKRTVERFSDADIKKLLSGRLLVDGAAARELAARGFSRYLGYTIDPKADIKYTRERSADGKRVYPMRVVPDYVAPRYDIVKGAEALTYLEYQPFGGSKDVRRVSPGAVYFENELGGKILSAAYLLDFGPTWNLQKFYVFCEPRKDWLRDMLDKVSGGKMPFVVEEMREIVAFARGRADGAKMLYILNGNRDPLEGVKVRVNVPFKKISVLGNDGRYRPARYVKNGDLLTFRETLACYEDLVLLFE